MRSARWAIYSSLLLAAVACLACGQAAPGLAEPAPGQGLLRILASDGEVAVPARIEVRNAAGLTFVAGDALAIGGDCADHEAPLTAAEVAAAASPVFVNAFEGREQFYSRGAATLSLDPGAYHVTVYRGPEHRVWEGAAEVAAGETVELASAPERWIDMAERGWFSADTHAHIPRPGAARDAIVLDWFRAEDLRVGNVLQWGNGSGFNNSPQFSFGPEGTARQEAFIALPGQEDPRTGFLGHAMILGASRPIRVPDYLNYRTAARQARDAGGLVGIGHSGEWGGERGLALLGLHRLIDFIEVFTFRTPNYELWYEALNAGLPVAATAGSDYPCGGGGVPPGAQRVYARVEGPLTDRSWIAAVRAGRTFVTNGPMLQLQVEGVGMGGTVEIEGDRPVRVRGSVVFDPERERVRVLDLLVNGQVVAVFNESSRPGEIAFEIDLPIAESSWVATRSFGTKPWAQRAWRNGFSHSGAIFVQPAGAPGPEATARASEVRERWRQRLRELFGILSDETQLDRLEAAGKDRMPRSLLLRYRLGLMRELQRTLQ